MNRTSKVCFHNPRCGQRLGKDIQKETDLIGEADILVREISRNRIIQAFMSQPAVSAMINVVDPRISNRKSQVKTSKFVVVRISENVSVSWDARMICVLLNGVEFVSPRMEWFLESYLLWRARKLLFMDKKLQPEYWLGGWIYLLAGSKLGVTYLKTEVQVVLT